MPGLLAVGVPYVTEAFTPRIGSRAMGYYVSSLVAGGLLGRVGVALLTAAFGWRIGVGPMAILPLAATIIMSRSLPEVASFESHARERARTRRAPAEPRAHPGDGGRQLHVLRVRRRVHVRGLPTGGAALLVPAGGDGADLPAVAHRRGRSARRPLGRAHRLASARTARRIARDRGPAATGPAWLPTLVLGLAMPTVAMFSTATAAQLGVGAVTTHNLGLASALYFSTYYVAGALCAYLPGFAWQAWRWPGVLAVAFAALIVALAAFAAAGPAARRIEARATANDRA